MSQPPRRPSKPGKGRHAFHHRPREAGERRDHQSHSADTRKPPRALAGDDQTVLYGYHAVAAALANPRRTLRRILVSDSAAHRLDAILAHAAVTPEIVDPRDLDRWLGADAVHQGMAAVADPLPEPDLARLCSTTVTTPDGVTHAPLLLVLDQVTDPHNVGALLRSAAVFGVGGMIMTRVHSPPLSGALAKAASGALEHVPVALVTNLARALETLADHDVRRIGLDGEGTETLENQANVGPAALVLGAEGKGLRRLTRENCDVLCRISTFGPLRSLNVSNAAAVALHSLRTRRAA